MVRLPYVTDVSRWIVDPASVGTPRGSIPGAVTALRRIRVQSNNKTLDPFLESFPGPTVGLPSARGRCRDEGNGEIPCARVFSALSAVQYISRLGAGVGTGVGADATLPCHCSARQKTSCRRAFHFGGKSFTASDIELDVGIVDLHGMPFLFLFFATAPRRNEQICWFSFSL